MYQDIIKSAKVVIISKEHCPSCEKLKMLFETINVEFKVHQYRVEEQAELEEMKKRKK